MAKRVKRRKLSKRKYKRGRRGYKSNRKSFGKASKGGRMPTGIVFPDVYYCKLNYRTYGGIAGGGLQVTRMAGNSIYDPDQTGTGHQPMYHDQLGDLYNNYRVMGSKIKVTFMAKDDTTGIGLVYPTQYSTWPTALGTYLELPYCRWKSETGHGAGGKTIVRAYMSTAKLLSQNKQSVLSRDDLAATFGSNPIGLWYWVVGFNNIDDGTVNQGFIIDVVYYVRCENRVRQTLS